VTEQRLRNRDYYDEFAKTYDRGRDRGYHALVDELETGLAVRHCAGRDVLEVGCGTGLILARLAEQAASATGVDLSLGMLARARGRGLRVAQGSATGLPFRSESFDVVCSFKVLAHVADIRGALSEMARVTRPGGTLVLEFYNRRSLRHLVKRLSGPQRIGEDIDEAAILTRFDTLETIREYLPAGVELVGTAGVRVFTPIALVHRVPLVRSLFGWLERVAVRSRLRGFGGFLVVELRRSSAS
jgi:ubiquinone/menaquinone biosynthesis C-methylase UbiE